MKKTSIRNHIVFIALWFAASIAYGFIWAKLNPQAAFNEVAQIAYGSGFILNFNLFLVFVVIFLNNSVKAFLSLVLGFFFGLAPLYFIFINGEIIGTFVFVFSQKIGIFKVILSLAPHGIFEIPAFILAAGYGLWLGMKFYHLLLYREPFREHLYFAMKKFVLIMIPLFLVAALVETYVTSYIVQLFAGR